MHILNNLPVPVIKLSPETKIVFSNYGAHTLFEWKNIPAKEPLFTDFLSEEDKIEFLDFFATISSTPSIFSTTLQLSLLSKKRITIKATKTEQHDRVFLLHQQDAWNFSCRELCEHAAILKAQYHHNPGGILMVTPKMEMLSFNEEFHKMWGIPVHLQQSRDDEASLKCVMAKVTDPAHFISKIESLYANSTDVSTDEIELKDGRVFYRHTYPIHNQDNYLGRVWYFLDITPLKRAQLQIEKQQIFQKTILENVQDGIISCNSEGKIDLMNYAARQFYGFTTTNPIGLDIEKLLQHKTDRITPLSGTKNPLRRALNGDTIENEEIVVTALDGSVHSLRVNGHYMIHDITNNIGAVVSLHDITDLNQAKEQLQFMAYHDPLTTLPNRRLFHDLLLQNLRQADRNIQKVGVLFLDMDNFKSINDLYGHNAGDELLKEVANTLQTCLRESDLICRWGGDEFVIALLENYGSDDIVKVAEKICNTVLQCIKQENSLFNVSVTIGVAISPEHGKDPDRLIRNADVAMYHAKKLGKNRCELFSKDPKPVPTSLTAL
ncbi:MAG: diguanylate cyclase (GGDEF)-like protein/PAS domain S-box-containing protein [Desulforhopalus sp.]|jgi:diguanylate cyclase (GGDEF)-like protein/PAS domain S-box-containing protein